MAFHTRSRDPLLDSNMQAAIEKRGKELFGIALICLGLAVAAMIGSYTPDDPNWMVSTDAPVQNWMGRFGASMAAPLFMIVGWGSWAIALVLIVWGLRFAFHYGEERAVARVIFAPIAVAVASIYAATLVPGAEWRSVHSFGLGGLFGDTVMGALLTLLPVGSHIMVKLVSLIMAVGTLGLGGYALGFTNPEMRRGVQFVIYGLILIYETILSLTGLAARGGVSGMKLMQERYAARRDARAVAYDEDEDDDGFEPIAIVPREAQAERGGFLSRMPSLIRRPEPVVEEYQSDNFAYEAMPGGDRIRAKIADIVKTRRETGRVVEPEPEYLPSEYEIEPVVTNRRGTTELRPEPPLTRAKAELRAEPPLTRAQATARVNVPVAPEPDNAFDDMMPFDDGYDDDEDDVIMPMAEQRPMAQVPVAEPRKVVQNPARKAPAPSRRAQAEAQPALAFDEESTEFELPPLGLLANPANIQRHHLSDEALEENARMLENVLDDYGVKGEIVSVRPGPVVTMYELEPAPGLKASRVIGLADDIARSMMALSARVSTVPGRSVIGIELPNDNREMVVLREILAARDFGDTNMSLPLALGKDIGGGPVVANLAKMPHLLIAGTTGSGKSVAINTMILSLLYRLTPEQCRLIMIDPKMLELSVYDGIPHLLSPVVTDPKKAVVALKWVVGEMEERYRKMSKMGVRNIEGYNGRVRDALAKGEMFSRTVQTGFDDETGEPVFETEEFAPEAMPFIVVIVDEMADLMMVAGKEIEACIQRLAQMARASGIHLIMATQRPSVDVITGTIKANFPTRISFQVTSKIDSRTILGEMGAEQLLGQGDMLYMAGGAKITRCHGPFVSDEEVEEVVNHLKAFGPPSYVGGVVEGPDEDRESDIDMVLGLGGNTDGEDALYDTAVQIVIKDRKCSTSYIQRKLAIGYNKAARLVEQMEEEGLVSPANHVGKREILVPEPQ